MFYWPIVWYIDHDWCIERRKKLTQDSQTYIIIKTTIFGNKFVFIISLCQSVLYYLVSCLLSLILLFVILFHISSRITWVNVTQSWHKTFLFLDNNNFVFSEIKDYICLEMGTLHQRHWHHVNITISKTHGSFKTILVYITIYIKRQWF